MSCPRLVTADAGKGGMGPVTCAFPFVLMTAGALSCRGVMSGTFAVCLQYQSRRSITACLRLDRRFIPQL